MGSDRAFPDYVARRHGLPAPHEGEPPRADSYSVPRVTNVSCQDRSLGYTELKVTDLAKPIEGGSGEFLYESTGVKEAEEPLKIGKGAFKGRLIYTAEFVPAYAVRGIHFESGPTELEQAAERTKAGSPDGSAGGTVAGDTDVEEEIDPEIARAGITASSPVDPEAQTNGAGPGHRKTTSVATTSSVRTSGTTAVEDEKRPEEQGVEMSKEELLKHRAYYHPILIWARA